MLSVRPSPICEEGKAGTGNTGIIQGNDRSVNLELPAFRLGVQSPVVLSDAYSTQNANVRHETLYPFCHKEVPMQGLMMDYQLTLTPCKGRGRRIRPAACI